MPTPTLLGGNGGKYLTMGGTEDQKMIFMWEENGKDSTMIWTFTEVLRHSELDWSPSGDKFVAWIAKEDTNVCDVYIFSELGDLITEYEMEGYNPQWSPDGQQLVFWGGESKTGNWDIYLMDFNGENVQRLTSNGVDDYGPRFVGDGSKIIFDNEGSLAIINRDGTEKLYLVDKVWDWNVSPDGTHIVYTNLKSINVVEIDGSNMITISSILDWGPIFYETPFYSPDGKWVTYYVYDCIGNNCDYNHHGTFIVPADGSTQPRLVATNSRGADWSPDGQWIYYYGTPRPGDPNYPKGYYIEHPDGTGLRAVLDDEKHLFYDDWQPSRKQIEP
jgi:TolB protein